MRLLVLSFYFAPDLSAGAFRTTALVKALAELGGTDSSIDVITTLPNRYRSFSTEAPASEERPGLSIRRIALPAHSSDVLGQVRAFVEYVREVLREVRGRRYDVVFGTSSRLMTAVLAAVCARRTGARLYLDIRDLFSDTVGDVFPSSYAWLLEFTFLRLERWAIRSADKVNLVSRGFAPYFSERYPEASLSFVTNGIDPEFLGQCAQSSDGPLVSKDRVRPIRILYAGNIGEGQGLHNVLPDLAQRLAGRAEFKVIGDGGRREALATALAGQRCDNVDMVAPMPRSQLLEEYRRADVLFLHLNDLDAFKKVLPSKLFEYAALGKPILAGVAGYAADFVRAEIENAAVFPPCNLDRAVESLATLRLEVTPRPEFIRRYGREQLMRQLAADVVGLATPPHRRAA